MKKLYKRMITATAATAGAAAAATAAAYLAAQILVRTALDREKPKIMSGSSHRISGNKKDGEFLKVCENASVKLKEKVHETVKIVSHDGISLIGHYYPCENAERIIIAFHGWRSSWNYDYGLISEFWHNNGCSVIYVEQRGQNNSGGDYMGFGLMERYDCIDWINWVICRCGRFVPIYLAGISMGAATVLMASDLDMPIKIHGIMADCGFTSPKAIWKHVAQNNLHIRYGVKSIMADAICKKKINLASDDHSTLDALSKTDIPILFVHGSDDKFVPVSMTYENYKACASEKRLLIVPGADHAMSYYTEKENYENAVLNFWKDFD